jgi:hypothetical protein
MARTYLDDATGLLYAVWRQRAAQRRDLEDAWEAAAWARSRWLPPARLLALARYREAEILLLRGELHAQQQAKERPAARPARGAAPPALWGALAILATASLVLLAVSRTSGGSGSGEAPSSSAALVPSSAATSAAPDAGASASASASATASSGAPCIPPGPVKPPVPTPRPRPDSTDIW